VGLLPFCCFTLQVVDLASHLNLALLLGRFHIQKIPFHSPALIAEYHWINPPIPAARRAASRIADVMTIATFTLQPSA
jgi:hypothetical protein